MTWRGFLARIGLAPAADVVRQRATYIRLFDRSLEREDYLIARIDALRAENANLKRAAADRLGEEARSAGNRRARALLPNTADDPPPFGHTWLATGIAPVDERAQAFGSITAVDCLEGDKPRD